MELKEYGISVSQIEPGTVQTIFESVAFEHFDPLLQHAGNYSAAMQAFKSYMQQAYVAAPDGRSTVAAMLHAATATKPKAIYRTTWAAKVLAPLRMWLGRGVFEAVIGAIYRRHRPKG